jgi:hypothetical protein
MTTAEFNTHARSIYFAAYYPAREIVAKQLRGLTLQDVVETTEKAILRFLGRTELEVVPRPTLAFSGFCEPRDTWNLISNIFHARWAAEKAVLEPEDEGLVRDMHKCEQMLHFMCQHDVEPEDIDGKPYDGAIREQTWLPRGSVRPVAAIPFL